MKNHSRLFYCFLFFFLTSSDLLLLLIHFDSVCFWTASWADDEDDMDFNQPKGNFVAEVTGSFSFRSAFLLLLCPAETNRMLQKHFCHQQFQFEIHSRIFAFQRIHFLASSLFFPRLYQSSHTSSLQPPLFDTNQIIQLLTLGLSHTCV